MAAYTIEDIELIRRKSGISYQEAVALLDYHNGNVARALVDLERNGRINPGGSTSSKSTTSSGGSGKSSGGSTLMNLLSKGYRARVKIHKGDTCILNLSVLFAILSLLISPHLVIIAAIVCLVLGYKFSFDGKDRAFAGENLERMVRSAADNVKSSVSDFARSFQEDDFDQPVQDAEPESAAAPESKHQPENRSYYSAERPAPTQRPNVPTLNVPVQVESQDGHVTVDEDNDGYSSATVE